MNFIGKYTKDGHGDIYSPSLKEIKRDAYFDNVGALQPGYKCIWTFERGRKVHCAMMALLQWGFEDLGEIYKKKMKLRLATFHTPFAQEIQLLLAMMRWDRMTRNFKLVVLEGMLKQKGATLAAVVAEAEAIKKEQDKLFDIGEIKDMYQLIDGIYGGNSREYVGDTPRQEKIRDTLLLSIQEKAIDAIAVRRAICKRVAPIFMKTIIQGAIHRQLQRGSAQRHQKICRKVFFASRAMPSDDKGPFGTYSVAADVAPRRTGSAAEKEEEGGWLGKWGRRLGITPAILSRIK